MLFSSLVAKSISTFSKVFTRTSKSNFHFHFSRQLTSLPQKSSLKMVQHIEQLDPKLLKRYSVPLNLQVVNLDCTHAFKGLSLQEKLYAHYMSQACWVGSLVVTAQTSPESPAIFSLVHDAFKTNGIKGLKEIALNTCGFSEEDWQAFLVYSCGVINECGNYRGFGDTKIIPALSSDKMGVLFKNCKLTSKVEADSRWNEIKERVYSLEERHQQLGLGEKGITTYFSANCTEVDAELIARFLKEYKLEPWNTRAFKTNDGANVCYEIRSASSDLNDGNEKVYDFEKAKFTLTRGDYSPVMKLMTEYLSKAKEYALNDLEKEMIEFYIQSFTNGSIDAHKEGSRCWLKDQGPVIETYIGFIENYRDPVGARSEFEGFVSIVNRELSKKFTELVENANEILELLPWPTEFERDTFMKPDFTSLDILTFSGSGIPVGINIPNYEEIRQVVGFKNVTLGNRILASFKDVDLPFFSKEDMEQIKPYFIQAFELQTGLHELLGHGSGLDFKKKEDGTTNFPADLRNPLNNELVESMYQPGESFTSVFCNLASPYEECRAETIGLFLSLDRNIQRVFGIPINDISKVRNANFLTALYGGIRSLDMYQPSTQSWMQAHSQAAFVTMNVMIEAGGGLVTIKEIIGSDGKPDLRASLDVDAIDTVGRKALSDFILKLQVFRSTADIKSAKQMFEKYSLVNDEGIYPWKTWREIVLDRKLPRKMCVQANTVISDDGDRVTLKEYDSSPEGLMQSFIERIPDVNIYEALEFCYQNDKPFFPCS